MATRGYKKCKVPKLYWTLKQDAVLVDCLRELSIDGEWKVDCSFRSGYLQELERMIGEKLPGCGIKAFPNIESRIKTLKKHTLAIQEMISQGSDFAWDDVTQKVSCRPDVFLTWCESHKEAKGLDKPFPHFRALIDIYGKDAANGNGAASPQEEEEVVRATTNNVDDDERKDITNGNGATSPQEEEEVIRANMNNVDDDEDSVNVGLDDIEFSSTQMSEPSLRNSPSRIDDRGNKRQKTNAFDRSFEVMATSFRTYVESSNAFFEKLANGFLIDHDLELGKDVVNELTNMEGLSEDDIINAASMIIGDKAKCSMLLYFCPPLKKLFVLKLLGKYPSS